MRYSFEELVQNFELERVGGAPNGYPLAPLARTSMVSGSTIPRIATDDAPMNFPVASLATAAGETPLEFLDKARGANW